MEILTHLKYEGLEVTFRMNSGIFTMLSWKRSDWCVASMSSGKKGIQRLWRKQPANRLSMKRFPADVAGLQPVFAGQDGLRRGKRIPGANQYVPVEEIFLQGRSSGRRDVW
jgi:hypothetical protein